MKGKEKHFTLKYEKGDASFSIPKAHLLYELAGLGYQVLKGYYPKQPDDI